MRSPDTTMDRIAALLQQGLDHYGRNEIEQAIACWRQVIELDPDQSEARDYLESAGVEATPHRAEIIDFATVRGDGRLANPELERLLREKRYEEALKLLYTARAHSPRDPAISRSIRLPRERIALDYTGRLVNLDRVPSRSDRVTPAQLSTEERQILALVDGISSYGDIVSSSSMGRLNTLRILCGFLDDGLVVASPPTIAPHPARSGAHPRALTQDVGPPTVPSARAFDSSARLRDSAPPPSYRPSPKPEQDRTVSSRPKLELPPSSRPSRPPPPDDGFDALFGQATHAYLMRDYEKAVALFNQCLLIRPDDRRTHHNLKTLQRRLNEP